MRNFLIFMEFSLLFGGLCFCIGLSIGIDNLKETDDRAKIHLKCHALYSDLVHEMWIKNPLFVEENMSGEAFKQLREFKDDDFEDEFCFWSVEDSLNYYKNGGKKGEFPYE